MKRKTIEVNKLKNQINFMLAKSRIDAESRRSMIVILEMVLMDTGNYNGFSYLGEKDVPDGHLPGIRNSAYDLTSNPTSSMLFDNTDNTRVCYL